MGYVLTINNPKGGVGKTTLAVHLAVGFAALGLHAVLIDTDPEGHVSLYLGQTDDDGLPHDGLFNCLMDRLSLDDVLLDVPAEKYRALVPQARLGSLRLLPGYEGTETLQFDLYRRRQTPTHFRLVFADLVKDSDLVIVDTSPKTEALLEQIFHMSDAVLIPTQAEALSVAQVPKVYENLRRFSPPDNGPQVLGILPMMTRPHTKEHEYQMTRLRSAYGPLVWAPQELTQSTIWPEASAAQQTVMQYDPKSNAAIRAWRVVRHLFTVLGWEAEHDHVSTT